jgi:COPI associated protein
MYVELAAILDEQALNWIVYLFIGSIMLGEGWYRWLPGTLVMVVGIGYAVLEFIPSIEPPANMR